MDVLGRKRIDAFNGGWNNSRESGICDSIISKNRDGVHDFRDENVNHIFKIEQQYLQALKLGS